MTPDFTVDAFAAEAAVREALERRMRGERFAIRFALLDDSTAVAASAIGPLVASNPSGERRRRALDALGARSLAFAGRPQRELTTRPAAMRAAMRELALYAHDVIAWSQWEADDLAALCAVPRERIRVESPRAVPVRRPAGAVNARALCIYAPGVRADVTALVVHALDDEEWRERIVVGDPAACTGSSAQPATDVAAALRSARAIVVVDPQHPGVALGLAPLGKPLAVPVTSGAREYLDGTFVYDPWDPRSIRAAVAGACEGTPPRVRPRTVLAAREAPRPSIAPRVSLVVRTRDRPQFLARALASIAAQTYPNIETVVVVDSGAAVDDVLAAHPPARTIVHRTPVGPVRALIAGMAATSGRYLGVLDDDDIIFPDHLERLVGALLAADGRVAQSMATALYARAETDGYRLYGASAFLRRVGRPDRLHIDYGCGPMSVLVRRDAFEESGGYDAALEDAEAWELLIRLSERDDVVFVPEVTAGYTIRPDENDPLVGSAGRRMIAAQQHMIAKASLAQRPLLERARRDLYERTLRNGGVARFPPPVPVAGDLLW
jgi:GT2 family glycosyltransferase